MTSGDGLLSPTLRSMKLPWRCSPRSSIAPLPIVDPPNPSNDSHHQSRQESTNYLSEEDDVDHQNQKRLSFKSRRFSQSRRSLIFKKKKTKVSDSNQNQDRNRNRNQEQEVDGSNAGNQEEPLGNPKERNRKRALSLLNSSSTCPRPNFSNHPSEITSDGIKELTLKHLKAMEEIGDLVCKKLETETETETEAEAEESQRKEETLPDLSFSSSSASVKSSSISICSDSKSFNSNPYHHSSQSDAFSELGLVSVVSPASITSNSYTRSFSRARNRASKSITGASMEDYRRWYSNELLPSSTDMESTPVPASTDEYDYFSSSPIHHAKSIHGSDLNPMSLPSSPILSSRTLTQEGLLVNPLPPPPPRSKSRTKSMGNILVPRNQLSLEIQMARSSSGGVKQRSILESDGVMNDEDPKDRGKASSNSHQKTLGAHHERKTRDFTIKPISIDRDSNAFKISDGEANDSDFRMSSRPSTSSGIEASGRIDFRKLSAGNTPSVPDLPFFSDRSISQSASQNRKRSKSETQTKEVRKTFQTAHDLKFGLGLEIDHVDGNPDGDGDGDDENKNYSNFQVPPLPSSLPCSIDLEEISPKNHHQVSNSPFMTPTFGSDLSPKFENLDLDDQVDDGAIGIDRIGDLFCDEDEEEGEEEEGEDEDEE